MDIRIKAPFRTHGETYENGEVTESWAAWNFDDDRLWDIIMEQNMECSEDTLEDCV